MKVTITDSAHLAPSAVATLESSGIDVTVVDDSASTEEVIAASKDADVLLVFLRPFDADMLDAMERPRLLIRCGIGYDTVDLEAATRRGIAVANVPDYCVPEVADHAMSLLLAGLRRLDTYRVRAGDMWSTKVDEPIRRLSETTLGILGAGRIGSAVADRAAGFGFNIVTVDPAAPTTERSVDLDTMLAQADAITLHSPLTDQTRSIISTDTLSAMKPGAVLVNTARGGLVDLDATVAALDSGQLAFAGLDVVEGEPTPDMNHRIFSHPRAVVTTHMAWYSEAARVELGVKAAQNAVGFLRGEPPRNVVNPGWDQA